MPTRIQFRRDTAANWTSANPALAAGELGYDTTNGRFKIGNGNTNWNSLPYTTNATTGGAFTSYASRGGEWRRIRHATGQGNPNKFLRMVTTKNFGTYNNVVVSASGYAAVLWWDGSVTIHGTGSAAANIILTKAIPTSGNYSGSSPKEIFAWPCLSAGSAVYSGQTFSSVNLANSSIGLLETGGMNISSLNVNNNFLRFLDVSDSPSLTALYAQGNPLQEIDLTGCDSLNILQLSLTQLQGTLDFSVFPELTEVNVSANNHIERIVLGVQPHLTQLILSSNTSLGEVDIMGCTGLQTLDVSYTSLNSLYVNSGSSLSTLRAQENTLSSIRCPGARLGGFSLPSYYYVGYGGDISYNDLSASALNQFYTDLGTAAVGGGYINADGNAGTSGDNPAIATAKGYTVYGT
jgi:Leucine-rich repeat (LRR) protein